ncbi:uncharacterized protein LOC117167777 [Belonocnema kinseyi]|uniref:uncharacterized protein LOC117167777 n=1 Tax=Belonocnema kinseyi TaxID=2817044 RepID=UPI00143DB4C3|nr:uncharacterized protein LOC117167777 [Belonocnema kinseyi]XP_033208840.1 uncharacterized protein LOC117167777 [Belonocnema kinseyi]
MAFLPAGLANRSQNERPLGTNRHSNGFSEKTEYKLYVSNLPPELNEDGIRQIFNLCGEVTGVLSPRHAGWAYVTYRNHREAVLAIGKLDDKSPLHLKVEFSKERQTKNVEDWKRRNVLDSSLPIETTKAPDFRDSGGINQLNNVPHRKLEIPLPERLRSRHMVPPFDEQDEILYPTERDPRTLNPFENPVPCPETNLLWTRGKLQVTDDGRRHVCMGRGYTIYKIPEPYHPRIEDSISAVYERRSNGLYEFGVDQLKNEVGRCELCGTITKMRCGKCSIFYCSRVCQKTDWEKHKTDCQTLMPLTGVPNPISPTMNVKDQLPRSSNPVKPELKERVNIVNKMKKEAFSLKQQEDKGRDSPLTTQNSRALNNVSQRSIISSRTNDVRRLESSNVESLRQSKNNVPDISKLQLSSPAKQIPEFDVNNVSQDIPQKQEKPTEASQQNKSTGFPKSSIDYRKVEEELAFQKKSFLSKEKLPASREQPLKIVPENVLSVDGVELETASESVNGNVLQRLMPISKQTPAEEEKTCFTMEDLETATLGKVGDTVEAVILHTENVGFTYFMCPMDFEMARYVENILPVQIEEYVAKTPEHYIPRDLELCFAPYEGSWYRGVCLKRNATPTSSTIFFVDYGNISQVEHKDLRLMTKDFMTPPALACLCDVQNLLPKKYEKDIPKKVEEQLLKLLAPSLVVKVKIISEDLENNYTIELPDIRNTLLKEQLI